MKRKDVDRFSFRLLDDQSCLSVYGHALTGVQFSFNGETLQFEWAEWDVFVDAVNQFREEME